MAMDIYQIKPEYALANGVWVVDTATIKFPLRFKPKESALVYVPPGQSAGNHYHERTEFF